MRKRVDIRLGKLGILISEEDEFKLEFWKILPKISELFIQKLRQNNCANKGLIHLDAEKNIVGSCDYYLNTNDFQYVDPVKNSKFVSIKHKNFVMTFDMLDKRNYGKIV